MSKGPSGSTTTTTTNPAAQAQLPFLQDLWSGAQNNFKTPPDLSGVYGGYDALARTAPMLNQSAGDASGLFQRATSGNLGVYQSPAYTSLSNLANQRTAPQQQLGRTASGAFLGANPYLEGEFNAAAQPVINSYMTATAPQTDSSFEAAGRYGGGAHANAQSINEQNLGTTLGNLGANLYGQDYAHERDLMQGAQSTDLSALLGTANTLESGYEAGNKTALGALAFEPSVLNAMLQPAQVRLAAAQGKAQVPYQQLGQYSNLIGQPVVAGGSTTEPYFNNTGSNALGAGLGILGLLGKPLGLF